MATDDSFYRVAQVRQLEQLACQQLAVSGFDLMQRAGQAAWAQLQHRWPDGRQLAVFCGGGNNAGDGYVLAALAWQAGYAVQAIAVVAPDQLRGDAALAYQAFCAAGGHTLALASVQLASTCVVVDALLGSGLNRAVSGAVAEAVACINASGCPVLALDVPSGIAADSGALWGCAVHATLTVTFIALKPGLFTGHAPDYCGEIVCADLGLPPAVLTSQTPAARRLVKQPLHRRSRIAHKGDCGRVLLVGGDDGYSGAIRLAAEAALRCGAGLVTVATRASHAAWLNSGRPELMVRAVEHAEALIPLLAHADVCVIGPGLGRGDWGLSLFEACLAAGKPLVVDADGLYWLATQPQQRLDWVLTPHPGEAARLLVSSTAAIAADRFAAVTALQQRYGGVWVLKGAGSLVADAHGIAIATTGNPGMASGGMGDVLAGMIGGLWGQGLSAAQATALAVSVHGEAADRVAQLRGERGLLASDLLLEIPVCLNHCES